MTSGTTPATAFFDSRVTGPARPAPHHRAGIVADRRGDADHPDLAFLVVDRATALAYAASAFEEPLRLVIVLACSIETGRDHQVDHLRRLKGEDRLTFWSNRGLAHAEVDRARIAWVLPGGRRT